MSRLLNVLYNMWNSDAAEEIIEEAADEAYNMAVDMCGNEGQVAIIDMTSYDAWYDAGMIAANGGDGLSTLFSYCPYPEAVGDILDETYWYMADTIMVGLDDGGDEGEDAWDYEGDFEGDGGDADW